MSKKIRSGGIGEPPHKLLHIRWLDVVLFSLLCLFLFLSFQAFIKSNPFLSSLQSLHNLKLLSLDHALTLTTTVVGLILLERQFSKNMQPLLQTAMGSQDKEKISLNNGVESFYEHRCYLKNQGAGRAVVKKVRYRLVFTDEIVTDDFNLGYLEVIEKLFHRDLKRNVDFYMPRYTENCTFLPPGFVGLVQISNQRFLECVKYLDIQIIYENMLGVRYMKEFPILPPTRHAIDGFNTFPKSEHNKSIQPTADAAAD